MEAMEKDIKSDEAEEGKDEVKSEARTDSIKMMSPLKTDFETPQMGLSARSTAQPASVESTVLGLMSGTMENAADRKRNTRVRTPSHASIAPATPCHLFASPRTTCRATHHHQ
jgi:hypothetical protein